MPVEKEVSKAVIRRLPRYYRFLGELLKTGTESRMQLGIVQFHEEKAYGRL